MRVRVAALGATAEVTKAAKATLLQIDCTVKKEMTHFCEKWDPNLQNNLIKMQIPLSCLRDATT